MTQNLHKLNKQNLFTTAKIETLCVLYYEGNWLDNKFIEKKINTGDSDASSRIMGPRSSLSHLPQKVHTNFPI